MIGQVVFKILRLKIAFVGDITKLSDSEFQIGITLTAKMFSNVISGI